MIVRYRCTGLGLTMKIKIQPETRSFRWNGVTQNAGAPAPTTLNLFANTGMGKRGLGVRPRMLVVRFLPGATPPAGYALGVRYRIPMLMPEPWESAIANQSVGLYLNTPCIVVGKLPEVVR